MHNCVVAAGAGSGKTFVFARRFAHLIADADFDIDSVLALTFTNKAASEMYERIYKTLKMLAASEDTGRVDFSSESAAAALRAKKALSDFHKARIQTMDSYCASVLRSSSRLYGIRPDFTVDEHKIERFVQKEALAFTLKHRKSPALQSLCRLQGVDSIARDFFAASILTHSVLARPFEFDSFIEKQVQKIAEIWQSALLLVDENASTIADAKTSSGRNGKDIADTLCTQRIDARDISAYTDKIRSASLSREDTQKLKDDLEKKLLPFFDALYEIKKIRITAKNKACVSALRNAYDSLSAAAQYLIRFPDMMSLIPLLSEFETSVGEWKRRSGTLAFADVSSLALKILIEQPHIRRAEKERIRCIMIDEFQDNNEQQRDMLFLLAETIERSEKSVPRSDELCPDKLFFVGDEKQSIYLFRGADVSVFKKLKNDLAAGDLSLSKNYRSASALIDAFNTFFGGFPYTGTGTRKPYSVFLQKEALALGGELPLFEAEYARSFAGRSDQSRAEIDGAKGAPPIHFFLLNKNQSSLEYEDGDNETAESAEASAADENEAVFVSSKIASLIREKKCRAQDIALLFRSYSHQHLYEKYLRLNGVPYTAETVSGFFSDAPVNDIYYFLRLIVYPQDVQAFGAVLVSPFVNLPLQAVPPCIEAARKDTAAFPVFFSAHTGACLCGDEAERFYKGLRLYERIRADAGSASCTDVLDELWYASGYRYETLRTESGALFAELYDYLYELARTADKDGKNLCGFTELLSEICASGERLQNTDIPLERADAVRLMSIHKSKGLEFPIVFICAASAYGQRSKNTEKLYADEEWGISFNFPPHRNIRECGKNIFFDLMRERLYQKSEAELRRLLYVAFTRAEREVYVSASFSLNKKAVSVLEKIRAEHADCEQGGERALMEELCAYFEAKVQSGAPAYSFAKAEYCVPNDSFFAFLLPVIVYLYAEQQGQPLPFTLEPIPLFNREDIAKLFSQGKKTCRAGTIADLKESYKKIAAIETPVPESPYRSPSQLYALQPSAEPRASLSAASDTNRAYSLIDEIVHSFPRGEFAYNHFGTIAHAFVEAAFSGKAAKIPPENLCALSNEQKQAVFSAAQTMADAFIRSDLGQQAKDALWRKNEYAFKLRAENPALAANVKDAARPSGADCVCAGYLIFSGQIDLVFETADALVVIDFKTDAHENPSEYVLQLAVYRRAAAIIRHTDISRVRTYVYYLRSGTAADITAQTEKADLSEAVLETSLREFVDSR